MALTVKLQKFNVSKCKFSKTARLEFRGVSQCTRIYDDVEDVITMNETFEWPLGTPVECTETLIVELWSRARWATSRVLGLLVIELRRAVLNGRLNVAECLVDTTNRPLPVHVELEIYYEAPPSCDVQAEGEYDESALEDDRQMLVNIEQNIANLERSLSRGTAAGESSDEGRAGPNIRNVGKRFLKRGFTMGSLENPHNSSPERKRNSTLRNMKSFMRLGKQRPPRQRCHSDSEEHVKRTTAANSVNDLEHGVTSRPSSQTSISSECDSNQSSPRQLAVKNIKPKSLPEASGLCALKAEDFQVCLTIIEARQLAGLNMDPVVCIQIGDQKKYTSVKESTNCPYYNEYFVFDFHMPPVIIFDKIITLSVLHSRNILRTNKLLGSFKLDVATVWAQPDHQFYHKWALLTDPEDVAGGPKGYLKCDISVIGKGDPIKVPPKSEKDEDDIEGNLLLPDGVPLERQRARFIVRVYRADGLPKMNSSIMANVKRAFTGEAKDLVDPYVQVCFAGMTGRTSVKKNNYTPVWNEQVVFSEMFPPLCQRIKIQLRDNDPVKPTIIGTHFIDLKTISNDGEKGFLPTFGPTFVHLYGSTRDYNIIDQHSNLNTGMGEGVSYRARLLIAIKTEITDNIELQPSELIIEPTPSINESSYGKNEEFLLFASILDASMLDKRLVEKPVKFELSIGNAGNTIDGHNESMNRHHNAESDELESLIVETGSWQSTTTGTRPQSHDKLYYFLPYWETKQCMHVRSIWPDYRARMFNSNLIAKFVEILEEGLLEVQVMLDMDDPESLNKLRAVMDQLHANCKEYTNIAKATMVANAVNADLGKTKLDKERLKMCIQEIENIGTYSRTLKAIITKRTLKERYKTAQTYLNKLKGLVEDPQHALPDIFIWLVGGGKRLAYQRIPARQIIYSVTGQECGKSCGKTQTLFLKWPGKKASGPSGWAIPAKLYIFFWLGLIEEKKHFIDGLPLGYEISHELKRIDNPSANPPSVIYYNKKHTFQLRAHIYQARSLIGSDASGLSDPFARVIVGEFCQTTQVIDETLSPTWDELLVFEEVLIYGTMDSIKADPPTIVIEIFDQDTVGKSEFIGRALAKPHVKAVEDAYEEPLFPPSLEWYEITRNSDPAGELLAAFELLELPTPGNDLNTVMPELPAPKELATDTATEHDIGPILPVPQGIRPTLSKYRIEVLFWGLRDLKRVHLMTVDKPRVDIECAGNLLYSTVIQNAKKNPNFSCPVKTLDVELPEQELYRPPLTIRVVDCRSFGRYTLVGTHMINSIHKYMYTPMTRKEREAEERKKSLMQLQSGEYASSSHYMSLEQGYPSDNNYQENCPLLFREGMLKPGYGTNKHQKIELKIEGKKKRKQSSESIVEDDDSSRDWWTKYFASVEMMIEEAKEAKKDKSDMLGNKNHSSRRNENMEGNIGLTNCANNIDYEKNIGRPNKKIKSNKMATKQSPKNTSKKLVPVTTLCKIYPNELEAHPDFEEFKEWLLSYDLYRGKKTDDDSEDENRVVGVFKGALKVYKWPLPKGHNDHTIMGYDPNYGLFQGLPSNEPIHVLVRVYIVKANDLHPMDLNGKADPYIVLHLGTKRISDKENYVSKQLNPVFGKCFEVEATFPQDSLLTIQILDWDLLGSDDMIGETRIDLENRFYSRHRATCGLPRKYEEQGYNRWRDALKPMQILAKLCKDSKMETPIYDFCKVKIGKKEFLFNIEDFDTEVNPRMIEENMALSVLNKWHEYPRIGCHLVPEHIETRPLYNPNKPGIEQGKLEMWVDMFPMDMPLPGPPTDISPRKPTSYELRVIIWNTDEVVLEDDAFFTGEKMSDIYVKGWLKGPEDCQSTDIHYRSLTGEGNFNWRFIFPFEYLVAEEKIVITRKESMFSWDETECKVPARLELQVWDADHFSADDFLGAITLDLNRFPRGAKSSKLCTLDMLKTDGSVPMVNIFKQKRLRGWWPFFIKRENEEMELTGKVEAEIHLLTKEEAERIPAGSGRGEPDPLDKPNRPDASFMWFLNPIKSIRYIVWHNYKWSILKGLIIIGLALLIFLFFYAIPGYTVKRILGA